jgi:hypothetical protein
MADKITSDQFETPEALAQYKLKAATFRRGMIPTPQSEIESAVKHICGKIGTAPSQFVQIAKKLSFWLNNTDGDCVTAEEAAAKAAYSVRNGGTELFVPDAEVGRWASAHGWLNGANLPPVMSAMAKKGFVVNGKVYNDGPHASVKYGDVPTLQDAIYVGPVKIGIDANGLPSGAGNKQGWFAVGGSPGEWNSEDHCVGLWGYGTAAYLYQQLTATFGNVPLPSSLPGTTEGFLLYTWSTVGFVDHARIMAMCGEAWVRNPTTVIGGNDGATLKNLHDKYPRLNPTALLNAIEDLVAAVESGSVSSIESALMALVMAIVGAPYLARKVGITPVKVSVKAVAKELKKKHPTLNPTKLVKAVEALLAAIATGNPIAIAAAIAMVVAALTGK